VYLISEDLALVQTVDFFTRSSTTRSPSDKLLPPTPSAIFTPWAAKPISALSIVGFPEKGDPAILEQIIRGGSRQNEEPTARLSAATRFATTTSSLLRRNGTIHPKRSGEMSAPNRMT